MKTLEQRFWEKVDVRGPDECWPWKAYAVTYGRFWGPEQLAHRVAWVLANGAIPGGLDVLHSCDNTLCVNPAHLWVGTHQDNMTDMTRKGRSTWKLRPYQVATIRRRLRCGERGRMLAREFGVAESTISKIKSEGR